MPSTIQTFNGSPATTGDEVVGKFTGTLYPAEITDIDTETDTPILTITEDGVGTHSGWTFAAVSPSELEAEPDMTWCWKHQPPVG